MGKLCSGTYVFNDLNNKSIQIDRPQCYATHRTLKLENKISRSLFIAATPTCYSEQNGDGAGVFSLAHQGLDSGIRSS
ncbi:MAG: hypothetical protein VX233_00905 [Candidatus Neomarinimicrobiota bacterium]|nr:hypothetical protein [Candidatus Neomarinimicrobiota bacterium]